MPLHLVKMCVGVDEVGQLREYQARRLQRGETLVHNTRNFPKRAAEILEGGSLFWVIKGFIRIRQRIVGLTVRDGEVEDRQGTKFCVIHLDPVLVETRMQAQRAFQGWRYLEDDAAPVDHGDPGAEVAMPAEMLRELRELGLL